MTDLQCKACQRVLADPNALYQHVRDAHGDVFRVGVKKAGRTLDGVIHDARPRVYDVAA